MRRPKVMLVMAGILAGFVLLEMAFAGGLLAIYPGFQEVRETKAYEQFRARPQSEFSKLLFLIDRFSEADIQIVYDGHYFSTRFVSRLARWFLSRKYRSETSTEWILRWCSTTVPKGNYIWVKLPDGRFRRAREILLKELQLLEQVAAEDKPKEEVSALLEVAAPALIAQSGSAPAGQTLSGNPPPSSIAS